MYIVFSANLITLELAASTVSLYAQIELVVWKPRFQHQPTHTLVIHLVSGCLQKAVL